MALGAWPRATLLAGAAFFLYLYAGDSRGLVGPDEPRYASIAREMAESGDWVTPRLNGEPWFEKPALLYWLGAAADRLGVSGDLATRVPVGLLGGLYLAFFYLALRRLFEEAAALGATLILGSAAGWFALSQVAVFDLPLAAALGVSLLCLAFWVEDENNRAALPWFGAWLGVAVLAKGLVGPAIAAAALLPTCVERGWLKTASELFHPRATAPFLAVCGPWYALCYGANGAAFVDEFFWRHHVARLMSPEIQHVQPWWFYAPVLAVGFAPWTPALFGLRARDLRADPKRRFLTAWAAGTLLLFSVSTNKLPGYVLPALPALAALLGARLTRAPMPRSLLAASAALLLLAPLAAALLPAAIAGGLSRAWPPEQWSPGLAAAAVASALLVAGAARRGPAGRAVAVLAAATALNLSILKLEVWPALDRAAGARTIWREIEPRLDSVCVGDVRRHVRYGLNYYGRGEPPDCAEEDRPRRVEGDPPRLVSRPGG